MRSEFKNAFQRLVDLAQPPERKKLASELSSGNVLQGSYCDESGRGCVIYLLTGGSVRTRDGRINHYASYGPDALTASATLVSAWDGGLITAANLAAWLEERRAAAERTEEIVPASGELCTVSG